MEKIELITAKSYKYGSSCYGDLVELDEAKDDYSAIFFDKWGNPYNHDDIETLISNGYSFNI